MIKISHKMARYSLPFKDILCCDCFYNEIYFLLRQKINFEIFRERFSHVGNCYFNIYGSILVICHDLLIHISQKYNLVGNKHCITDLIDTGSNQTIELCTICSVDVFRKAEILHIFKLEW